MKRKDEKWSLEEDNGKMIGEQVTKIHHTDTRVVRSSQLAEGGRLYGLPTRASPRLLHDDDLSQRDV